MEHDNNIPRLPHHTVPGDEDTRPDRIAEAWQELRDMFAGEIAAINMLGKLSKKKFTPISTREHGIWDAAYAGVLDLVAGNSLARVRVCSRSGELEITYFRNGIPIFTGRRLQLNCLTATRRDLRALLSAVQLAATPPAGMETR